MQTPRLPRHAVLPLIRRALREDRVRQDITSRSLAASGRVRAHILAKTPGRLAGGPLALWTFRAVDPSLRCALRRREGAALRRGQVILTLEGRAGSILAAERTALNFLGHLSGIATLTHAFVHRTRPYRAKILDTRKTLPGLRVLEKYAVQVGGGARHRASLAEAILIKTNHLRVLGRGAGDRGRVIARAIAMTRRRHPRLPIEIEATNLREVRAALEAQADIILLDNMPIKTIRQAVRLRSTSHAPRPTPLFEISGGVTLANVRQIAATGVERISIGRLTHSAPILDLSLTVVL